MRIGQSRLLRPRRRRPMREETPSSMTVRIAPVPSRRPTSTTLMLGSCTECDGRLTTAFPEDATRGTIAFRVTGSLPSQDGGLVLACLLALDLYYQRHIEAFLFYPSTSRALRCHDAEEDMLSSFSEGNRRRLAWPSFPPSFSCFSVLLLVVLLHSYILHVSTTKKNRNQKANTKKTGDWKRGSAGDTK